MGFSHEFGWVYPIGHGSYDNWIFFPKHGWMWTNSYVYPNFYSDKDSAWYQYDTENYEYGWFIKSASGEKKRIGRVYPN